MIHKLILIFVVIATTLAKPSGWWAGTGGFNPWIPSWGGWNVDPTPWFPWSPRPPIPVERAAANPGVNPWIWPPLGAAGPRIPQWVPCSTLGSDCLDCTTKVVCTKVGGIQSACTNPAFPYCNLGKCSAIPATGCASTNSPLPTESTTVSSTPSSTSTNTPTSTQSTTVSENGNSNNNNNENEAAEEENEENA